MTIEEKTSGLSESEREFDAEAFQKVKELVLSLANTISALKLFPAHHVSARHFRQEFINKLKAFLEQYQKLELEVGEFAFYFQGKPVYQDEISSKSLPFFFYKDGLRALALYQGMDDQEINDLLDLIRSESMKPVEESDLVNALWLKDLPNVQYYAPEEFIENRILEERSESLQRRGLQIIPQELAGKVVDIRVDREKIFSGKVELRPEEKQALESFREQELPDLPETWQQTLSFDEDKARAAREGEEAPRPETARPEPVEKALFSQAELELLNQLVERNRKLSPEEEFLNLMVEILALEKDLERYKANLEVLHGFFTESIKGGRFEIPVLINRKLNELRLLVEKEQPEKIPAIESLVRATASLSILDEIRNLVDRKTEFNYLVLLEYIKQFGEKALFFLGELYEKIDYPEFRKETLELIRKTIDDNPSSASFFIDDQKPLLTEAVIDLMREMPAKRIIPQFSNFLTLTRPELKIKAIEALSNFQDEMASKILLGFMNDSHPDVRLKATSSLKYVGDEYRLLQLIKETSSRSFRQKPFEEKKALFEFLGRTRHPEAFRLLRRVFLKKSLMPSSTELRLCAVAGLEANQSPEAIELLRRGARFFNRRVREAASQALLRLTLSQERNVQK